MRKLIALVALLLGCLFVAQSTMAATARYDGCCIEDCKGMAQCVGMGCQLCAVSAAVAAPAERVAGPEVSVVLMALAELHRSSPFAEIWTPPD